MVFKLSCAGGVMHTTIDLQPLSRSHCGGCKAALKNSNDSHAFSRPSVHTHTNFQPVHSEQLVGGGATQDKTADTQCHGCYRGSCGRPAVFRRHVAGHVQHYTVCVCMSQYQAWCNLSSNLDLNRLCLLLLYFAIGELNIDANSRVSKPNSFILWKY